MIGQLAQRPIIVIEDSDEDYEVTVWALREAGVANPVYRCADSAAIFGLLTERSLWPSALRGSYPLLVLLDLNLPGTDAREVLGDMRRHPFWQAVPVVIVSTSQHPPDVSACYRKGAAGFLRKSLDLDRFAAAIRQLSNYWFKTVVPPVPADY